MASIHTPDVQRLVELLRRIPPPPWAVDTTGLVPLLRDSHGAPVESPYSHAEATSAALQLMAEAPTMAQWIVEALTAADQWAAEGASEIPTQDGVLH